MQLKPYQVETLESLRRFLEEARIAGPAAAYAAAVRAPERAARLGRLAGAYRPLEGLPDTPHVCLRLPTGGGKTLLAAHAVAVARKAWIEKEYPLVLWLAPTTTIRRQTAEALKNARHPYRRALDAAFDGRTRVLDIADFAQLRPHDLRSRCCVVVGTIQTLRVKNTEGRKVYAHHEDLEPHFAALANPPPGLARLEDGGVEYSFANLLCLHRPLMIVDEAHNAVTGLTREMQRRVNPCAVVEFTATPRRASNILDSVSARELKREAMIKLPIALAEHRDWRSAVAGAVARRAALAKAAAADRDYIRPVALFQAQPKNREVTAEALKRHLVDVEQIPEHRIAVATGDQRELDGIDLFDPACPIEHVVTVQALKEGWDCAFAYVFCTVGSVRAAADVEQLLGRVLRMPYASRRADADLNKAWAFACEPDFGAAARDLADKLVAMGFEDDEAEDGVEPAPPTLDEDGSLFAPGAAEAPAAFRYVIAAPPDAAGFAASLPERAAARAAGGGKLEIAVAGWPGEALERAVARRLPAAERPRFARAAAAFRQKEAHVFPPAARGEVFAVPALVVEVQGALELADPDVLLEDREWSLADRPFRLDAAEFAIRETAHSFLVDLGGRGEIEYRHTGEEAVLPLDLEVEGWTPEALAGWLDREVRAIDLAQGDLLAWLSRLVHHLTAARGISVSALMRCKFLLARAVRARLDAIRAEERRAAYQGALFAPGARPDVSFDAALAFRFRDGAYRGEKRYRGPWRPSRHFLGPGEVPAFGGPEDGGDEGEEFRCAQAIDSLPAVEYWIRNVARHPASFRLPLASGWFYPDFVALLKDGRILVVEYKGAHLLNTPETIEKRAIGDVWERRSAGRGLFALAVKQDAAGNDPRAQLLAKIGAG